MQKKGLFSIRNAIISFIVFILMFIVINQKPIGLARLQEITGGPSILDMLMEGYSVDKAYEVLDALGNEGRAYDLGTIVPLDFPFPLAYSMFYFITITLLAKNIFTSMKKPWLIGLAGIAAGIFDWLENTMIIIMLKNYPTHLNTIAGMSNIFTILKSAFTMICMGLILIGLVTVLVKRLVRKPVKK